jgi:hypothetical protein
MLDFHQNLFFTKICLKVKQFERLFAHSAEKKLMAIMVVVKQNLFKTGNLDCNKELAT